MPDESPSRTLPAPAPGLLSLVWIHLRLIHGEARSGTAVLGVVTLGFPLLMLLIPLEQAATADGTLRAVLSLSLVAAVVLTLTYLWPEAVWGKLRPGSRMALDSLPVSRLRNRMARVMAGAILPLVLGLSLMVGVEIGAARGLLEMVGEQWRWNPLTLLTLLASYAMASALALRFGKVFVPLLAGVLSFWVFFMILVLLEWEAVGSPLVAWLSYSPLSPRHGLVGLSGRVHGVTQGPSTLGVLFWLLAFGSVVAVLSRRHDRV